MGRGSSCGRLARLVGSVWVVLSRELPPLRNFEVRLRHHVAGASMAEDLTYRWEGRATDEAHAVVLAKQESKAHGWSPDGPVACRVVESTGFLPVTHEWVDTAS